MPNFKQLFINNKNWADRIEKEQPGFFRQLSEQQAPEYLWIGCSDSRVPANEIVGLLPGELFVHRNVANLVVHSDMNCLSVLQYAIDILKVKHILVVGHYGCGGVKAALTKQRVGFVDNWLRNVKDVYALHREEVDAIADEDERLNRLIELNVADDVEHFGDADFALGLARVFQHGCHDVFGMGFDCGFEAGELFLAHLRAGCLGFPHMRLLERKDALDIGGYVGEG